MALNVVVGLTAALRALNAAAQSLRRRGAAPEGAEEDYSGLSGTSRWEPRATIGPNKSTEWARSY